MGGVGRKTRYGGRRGTPSDRGAEVAVSVPIATRRVRSHYFAEKIKKVYFVHVTHAQFSVLLFIFKRVNTSRDYRLLFL